MSHMSLQKSLGTSNLSFFCRVLNIIIITRANESSTRANGILNSRKQILNSPKRILENTMIPKPFIMRKIQKKRFSKNRLFFNGNWSNWNFILKKIQFLKQDYFPMVTEVTEILNSRKQNPQLAQKNPKVFCAISGFFEILNPNVRIPFFGGKIRTGFW